MRSFRFGLLILLSVVTSSVVVSASDQFFLNPVGTIILDAGHGGRDPGAIGETDNNGVSGLVYEKDITLALVQQVGAILHELYQDIQIAYTRTGDEYVSLGERTHYANSLPYTDGKSKIFVSIHVNAANTEAASGYEIWKLREYVYKDFYETNISESGLVQLTAELNEDLNRELDIATAVLASSIESALQVSLSDDIRDRGIKQGMFYVLEHAVMPSVLIEAGFITNDGDCSLLRSKQYQEQLSFAIASGIAAYIEKVH